MVLSFGLLPLKLIRLLQLLGYFEPKSSVEEIDSPVTGVVSEVFVEDGQFVKSGTPLVEINSKGLSRRRDAVNTTIEILQAQNSSLARILSSDGNLESLPVLASIPVGVDEPLRSKLVTAIDQSREILARLRQIDQRIISKSKTLDLLQIIQSDLRPLYEEGVVSRIQYLRQSNTVQEKKAELVALREDRSSVLGAVAGRINSINRDLENLQSELARLSEDLSFRVIKAPIDGKVFDVRATSSSLLAADQVVLKLVPDDQLVARVSITNRDIGFVKTGLPVTVGVDSFPVGEFGYIDGVLSSIGSDALPPDGRNSFYRFPATISLKQQDVQSGDQSLNLQSGMSVTANIRLRSRPVINIISDMFTKQMDGVKRFR